MIEDDRHMVVPTDVTELRPPGINRWSFIRPDKLRSSSSHTVTSGGFRGFMADVRDVVERYSKRTSVPHKRSILLLIVGGALLRIWMMALPITYEEARAFDLYIAKPFGTIISDRTEPINHILYSVAAKASVSIFGPGIISLRLPALLASILAMPLFYLFVRAMFNRYIAMLALALVASSAPLIEYSAMAHGHAFTWAFMVLGLVLGRHFAKTNNVLSAVMIGITLALGMWTMTAMIHPALSIYVWLLIYILMRYEGSLRKRMNMLMLSILIFILVTFLLYLPIISHHGFGILFDHPTLPDRNWKAFVRTHQDGVFDLWVAIVDTTGLVVALLGILALLVSAFISSKYRVLMFAMLIGAVPIVLMKARIAPPPEWFYMLFLFHIGSAIALFYLLKLIQEKLMTSLGKRTRTALTSAALFALLSTLGIGIIMERTERFPEAAWAADYLAGAVDRGDRIFIDHPWDAPVKFHAQVLGLDRSYFQGLPEHGSWLYLIVAPYEGQSETILLKDPRFRTYKPDTMEMVKDWNRLEIFAAR